MRDNPIQFALVREDPAVELELAPKNGGRALVIGSGGCTALALKAERPGLAVTVVDPNPAQLGHLRRKIEALARPAGPERDAVFNVGSADPKGLNACGNFESLFRSLAGFLREFVCDAGELEAMFESDALLSATRARLTSHRYWPVAFQLYFSDPILLAMFGPDAIQHAEPGSYPGYFQRVYEKGLARADARSNPFLQQLFLGRYLAGTRLPYFQAGTDYRFDVLQCLATDVPSYAGYDLVSLSNIMDWMSPDAIAALARKLAAEMTPRATLLFRQLNHRKTFDALFDGAFRMDEALAARLLESDRSLFYSRLNIAVRR